MPDNQPVIQPVIQQNHVFDVHSTLLLTTDIQSLIVGAHDAFVNVSGCTTVESMKHSVGSFA